MNRLQFDFETMDNSQVNDAVKKLQEFMSSPINMMNLNRGLRDRWATEYGAWNEDRIPDSPSVIKKSRKIQKQEPKPQPPLYTVPELKKYMSFSMPADFGFEATWRPADMFYFEKLGASMGDLTSSIEEEIDKLNLKDGWPVENEGDVCIETPSPKYEGNPKGFIQFISDYRRIFKLMKKIRMVPSSHDGTVYNDGGGHIHISIERILEHSGAEDDYENPGSTFVSRFIRNFYVSTINNPWVNWAFNSPIDNENANSLLTKCSEKNMRLTRMSYSDSDELMPQEYAMVKKNWETLILEEREKFLTGMEKNFPVIFRGTKQTLEFRFFCMPETEEELLLHFQVAKNWYEHIFKVTKEGQWLVPVFNHVDELKKIPYKKALSGLKKFCKEIGVDWKNVEACGKPGVMLNRYELHSEDRCLLK